MVCMVFTVSEEATGWFVKGSDRLGPFFSRERAVDLAEGMVSVLRAAGEEVSLVIEPRSWTTQPPRRLKN